MFFYATASFEGGTLPIHSGMLKALEKWGLPVSPRPRLSGRKRLLGISELLEQTQLADLPDQDGVVYKLKTAARTRSVWDLCLARRGGYSAQVSGGRSHHNCARLISGSDGALTRWLGWSWFVVE